MTATLAITVIMPEAEARAMLAAAAASGDLLDPSTVEIEGFVIVSAKAFERLSKTLREVRGGEEAGADAQVRSGPRAEGEDP